MQFVLCILLFIVLVQVVQAKGAAVDESHASPLNPEFILYMKERSEISKVQTDTPEQNLMRSSRMQETDDSKVLVGINNLGLIPSPIYRPEVRDVQMFGSPSGDHTSGSTVTYDVLTSSYSPTFDLRTSDKISPVKDQTYFGTCWAFATYGSLESTLMTVTPIPDFSEKNLANLAGFDFDIPDGGGNMWMSAAYLTRWNGPVNETADPYPANSTWTPSSPYPPVKHVQNIVFFPARTNRTDTGNIKDALKQWGAVYSSLYWSNLFYNTSYTSYYQPASAPDWGPGGGHAVTIVGWDDNYAATNFTTTADGPGAWIVKNSWGTGWGNAGYFYVSYYDKKFGSALYNGDQYRNTAVFRGESTSNYDTVYSYEKLGEVRDFYGATIKTGSFANVYTANSSEIIKAVGFYTTDLNVLYTISIYKNPTSGPVGGTPAATFSGTLANMGYHTVVIPSSQQIPVTTGDKFSIIVQVTNPTNDYYIPVEVNEYEYTSEIVSQSGQGYVINGSGWTDWKTIVDDSNICVKAYTSPPPPVAGFAGTPRSGTAPLTVTFTDTSTGTPTNWNWDFGDGNISTVKNPVFTYATSGYFTVRLNATNTGGSSTKTALQYISVAAGSRQNSTVNANISQTTSGGQNNVSIDTTGMTILNTTNQVIVTNPVSGWQTFTFTGTNITNNAGFVNLTVSNVTMDSTPFTAALPGLGMVSTSLVIGQNQMTVGTLQQAIITGANTTVTNAFQLAATNNGLTLGNISYILQISGSGPFNNNLTTSGVVINMSVSHAWVLANGGTGAVRIFRYSDTGTPQMLTTTFAGTDPGGIDYFIATSFLGFSEFGLGGTSISPGPDPFVGGGGDSDTFPVGPVTPATPGTGKINVGGNSAVAHVTITGTGISGAIITGTVISGPGLNTAPPAGNVYQYIEITPARYSTISNAVISFTVPATWLTEHQLTPQNIVMNHLVGESWVALPTTLVKIENGNAYYTAVSPGFSRFAISGQAGITSGSPQAILTPAGQTYGDLAPTTSVTTSTLVAVIPTPGTTQTTAIPAATQPAPGFPLPTIAIAVGIILVLIAGGFLIRRWLVQRQNPALFRKYD
ncbi:MAG: lectin like domain-containing protein [Methanoregula sp.]|nr:lectin like domain-containing protein [Methanoregula sp.]